MSYESHRNLLTQVSNNYNSTTVSNYNYTNDAIGRRSAAGWSGTAFSQSDTITYGYNDRSEVTGANAANNANYGYSFAFDPIGNRLTSASKETGTTVTRNYTSNLLNQYTAIDNPTAAPTYDFDGNMTSMPSFAESGTWSLTWDAENRLVLAEKSDAKLEFKYDYVGRRVEKKIYSGSTGNWTLAADLRFVYDGYLQIEELALDIPNSQFVIRNCRVWSPALQGLGSEKYLSETQGGTTYYALGDANKNVTEYLDASGAIKAHYEFSPFGKVVNATGTMSSAFNYRFSSEYLDVETGLVYYCRRYYSPEFGKWLSMDPIGEREGGNLYCFLLNSSLNRYDYLGLGTELKGGVECRADYKNETCEIVITGIDSMPEYFKEVARAHEKIHIKQAKEFYKPKSYCSPIYEQKLLGPKFCGCFKEGVLGFPTEGGVRLGMECEAHYDSIQKLEELSTKYKDGTNEKDNITYNLAVYCNYVSFCKTKNDKITEICKKYPNIPWR